MRRVRVRFLALIALCLLGLAATRPAGASENAATAPADVAEVTVGKTRYAIPRSYILAIRRDPETAAVRRVMMRALWPGLEPHGMEMTNRLAGTLSTEEFIRRHVFFSLEANPRNFSRFVEGGEPRYFVRESGPFGLTKYTLGRTLRNFVASEPPYATPTGQLLVLLCSKLRPGVKERFEDATPMCIVSYPLAEGGEGIYYRYYFVDLANWRDIDGDLRALIRSFQR